MTDFEEYVAEKLKDPEFKAEFDALEPEYAIIQAMIDARKESGLTQKELSEKTKAYIEVCNEFGKNEEQNS